MSFNVPIINGIVVADNIADAEERIIGKLDQGYEFAHAAIEMGNLHNKWTKILVTNPSGVSVGKIEPHLGLFFNGDESDR